MKYTFKIIAAILLSVLLLASCRPVDNGGAGGGIGRDPTPTLPLDGDPTDTGATSPATSDVTSVPTLPPTAGITTETNRPDVTEEKRVSFLAVGDNIVHDAVRWDAEKRASAGTRYNFRDMYADIEATVKAADIAFVNMESPVAGEAFGYSGYPFFNAPEEAVTDLIDVGFDVFNINNNHMLDMGGAGLASTINYFRGLDDILMIGGYMGEGDLYKPRTITMNGITIGFVSINYCTNNVELDPIYGITIPHFAVLTDNKYVIDDALLDDMEAWVKKAAESCDYLIASVHFGDEGTYTISADQRRVAEVVAEAGADAIIGHHPHVIQSVEMRTNSDGSQTVVAYSLGNFISTQYYDYNMLSGMITFDIVMDENGVCTTENVLFMPIITHYSMNRDGLQVYHLENYSEALASTHGTVLYSPDFTYAKMIANVKYLINKDFLSDFYK